jgi:hypothetical protein
MVEALALLATIPQMLGYQLAVLLESAVDSVADMVVGKNLKYI